MKYYGLYCTVSSQSAQCCTECCECLTSLESPCCGGNVCRVSNYFNLAMDYLMMTEPCPIDQIMVCCFVAGHTIIRLSIHCVGMFWIIQGRRSIDAYELLTRPLVSECGAIQQLETS